MSNRVIVICMAMTDVLKQDFYVLSFVKLMKDDLGERRKSSRRELFRNNELSRRAFCQIESFLLVWLRQMFRNADFTARWVLCNFRCIPNHLPQ